MSFPSIQISKNYRKRTNKKKHFVFEIVNFTVSVVKNSGGRQVLHPPLPTPHSLPPYPPPPPPRHRCLTWSKIHLWEFTF